MVLRQFLLGHVESCLKLPELRNFGFYSLLDFVLNVTKQFAFVLSFIEIVRIILNLSQNKRIFFYIKRIHSFHFFFLPLQSENSFGSTCDVIAPFTHSHCSWISKKVSKKREKVCPTLDTQGEYQKRELSLRCLGNIMCQSFN